MPPTLLLIVGTAAIFISIVVGLIAAGALSDNRPNTSRSLALVDAFSSAPQSMKDELDPGFKERVLNPALSRLTGLGRRLTPADSGVRTRHKLDAAGNPSGWTPDRISALKAGGFAAALLLGLMISMLLGWSLRTTLVFSIALSLAGYCAPNMWLYQKAYERRDLTQRSLPDSLDLLTISVEAGLGFDAALAHVAKNTEGPLAEEFSRVLQEMQLGSGRSEAMRGLGERSSLPELNQFVTSLVQADAFGIPVGRVLRVQSAEMRTKRRQRAEEKAQKVPVKILFPLIFCILPTLFIVVMGPGVISMVSVFQGSGG